LIALYYLTASSVVEGYADWPISSYRPDTFSYHQELYKGYPLNRDGRACIQSSLYPFARLPPGSLLPYAGGSHIQGFGTGGRLPCQGVFGWSWRTRKNTCAPWISGHSPKTHHTRARWFYCQSTANSRQALFRIARI